MRVSPEKWEPGGIKDLEDAAWKALRAPTSAVTAGPGAGKTEFLAQRASYLLETGICRAPQQILAISFKRDAARNLHRRLSDRLPDQADRVASMTFDAFTKSIIDRFGSLLPAPWAITEGYRIAFSNQTEVRGFLDDIAGHAPQEFRDEIHQIRPANFLSDIVGAASLLADPTEPISGTEYAIAEWWKRKYRNDVTPLVDFVMLNRLAELLIRSSPQLQRALRLTYPYVFIDEFQDTTYAQYTFLTSVFPPSSTYITVVGDDKQRIMGWAGALTNAFDQFTNDYGDNHFELQRNFRSRQELVDLQHRFAVRLKPAARPQASQVVSEEDGVAPVQAWSFATSSREAETVAAWIAADIEQSGRDPSQYALIARQKVTDLEPSLAEALGGEGLSVRNDDASLGKLKLGDVLKDELVELLIGLVQLAAIRGGQPEVWRAVTTTLARARPSESAREVGSHLDDELAEFLSRLRSWFVETPIDHTLATTPGAEQAVAEALTDQLYVFVQLENAASKRIFADRAEDITEKMEAFMLRLEWALGQVDTWGSVAHAFLDEDAIPLMTIHRSKGLEYHTVFFIGLDGDQWWAHSRDMRLPPDGGHRDSGIDGSAGRMSSCPANAGLSRPSTRSRPPAG
ncbi:DEAD/DEAH box helicase, partial [Rhodococcus sp. H36-A4]|uniref:DEAD/DEAH box helicase n=1 Tax=Rhodococcus sp. H36-A4 TaxID=3004353 RepID=UPI0022B06483